ncbi:MAG: hypothetical protein K2J67_09235 [Lachnospiraceae bacterium]|nr:hypothetical protein [Lachnospiraceae bacterium]
MKMIEGKQAVLRPYRRETDCVLSQRVLNVQPLEPVICPVAECSTAQWISGSVSDAETQKPVEYVSRKISDTELQRPVECVPRRMSDMGLQEPIECIPKRIPVSEEQTLRAAVQAPVACIPQTASGRSLQPARAQVIPATPEWGQTLEETMSGRKKRKWLAETILHMMDS